MIERIQEIIFTKVSSLPVAIKTFGFSENKKVIILKITEPNLNKSI